MWILLTNSLTYAFLHILWSLMTLIMPMFPESKTREAKDRVKEKGFGQQSNKSLEENLEQN